MGVDASSVHVNLGERSYEIRIVSDGLAELPALLPSWLDRSQYRARNSRLAHIVTDRNVRRHADVVRESLIRAGWMCGLSELEPGEKTKSVNNLSSIWDALIASKADRQTVIIAVGGGVIGDLAGFAAASFVRGLPFVQVPTSLLADVDSSVGGKTGINHPAAKNMLGAFHQPVGVLIDTAMLETLPAREFSAGLAEVVKYGVILDADFFTFLEQRAESINRRDPNILRQVVARCCRLKADVVEKDEFERTGLRAVLNYGHIRSRLRGTCRLRRTAAWRGGRDRHVVRQPIGRASRLHRRSNHTSAGRIVEPLWIANSVASRLATLGGRGD